MPRTAGRPIPVGQDTARRRPPVLPGPDRFGRRRSSSRPAHGPRPSWDLPPFLWYNGLYTWLKAHSAFAAIPGALVGAIPPAIGWTAGGGCFDVRLAAVCFFFFMWQVPHFLIHQRAFGKEYEEIRLPSLTAVFTGAQLDRLTFQWLLAAAVSLQLFIFYGLIQSSLVHIALLAASLWLAARGIALMMRRGPSYPGIFRSTNCFMLAAMLLIVADRFPRCLG